MRQRSLLLLGILQSHSQHGYQINEFIENKLGCLLETKKATAYATLDRLHEADLVDVTVEQVGNRPPRKVYSVTPKGHLAFLDLLRTELANPGTHSIGGDVGLMFVYHLAPAEAAFLLDQRLAKLDATIAALEMTPKHPAALGVDIAMSRRISLLRADRDWLTSFARGLSSETPDL